MIKRVDDIPKSGRTSYREQIRRDIREAIDNDINKFEFIGDYNYKYLSQYVREEASRIFSDICRNKFNDIKLMRINEITEKGLDAHGVRYSRYESNRLYESLYKVTQSKHDDRNHVYMELYLDDLDYLMNDYFEKLLSRKSCRE